MATKANIELDAGCKSFATGLLPELIGALRRCGPGDLLAVDVRNAAAEIVAAVPLEPASRIVGMDPALGAPDRQRLAGAGA